MKLKTKRNIQRPIALFLLSVLFLWIFGPLATVAYADDSNEAPTPFPKSSLQAKAAYLINADNGEVLYAHNENNQMTPASITKIMTLLITNDKLKSGDISLSDKVKISEKSWKTQGSRMFLEVGTEYSVKELIKGVAIVSGNDAAVSLAEHISGSTDDFIPLMNEEAKKIGMNNTVFRTVNGLPANGVKDSTTAKDLATLANYYIHKYPKMLKIHSTKEYTTKMFRGDDITQKNSNSLLDTYKGMDGLKTGFADYYNFVGTAKKGKIRLIVVTLGSSSDAKRMATADALLNYGFEQYQTFTAGKKGEAVDTLNVYKAVGVKEANVTVKNDVTYGINVRDKKDVKIKNDIPDYLLGGKKKGDVIGKQIVNLHGKKLAEGDIIVTKDLPRTSGFVSFFHEIALLFNLLLSKLADKL